MRDFLKRPKASDAYKKAILESALDCVITIDHDGRILEFNPVAERTFGYTAEQISGKKLEETIIPPSLREQHRRGLKNYMATGKGPILNKRIEMIAMRKDGAEFPVELTVVRIPGEDPPKFCGYVRDLTDRRRAEDALRRSRHAYAALVESIDGIVWELDAQTFKFTFVSKQAERMLGYPLENWLEKPGFWAEHIHPDDREWAVSFCVRATAEKKDHQFEYRMLRADGTVVWLHDIVTVVIEDGRPAKLRGVMVDITERKQAEEDLRKAHEELDRKRKEEARRLRGLAARLESAREDERNRVAREIHDELGQSLTGLKFEVSSLLKKISPGQQESLKKLAAMQKLIDATIQSVRRISAELRPRILDDLGLLEAIKWQAKEFQKHTGIPCAMDLPGGEITWNQEKSTAMFRIFQETLTNIARHAGAAGVEVRVQKQDKQVVLEVRDNGRGIAEERLSGSGSFGLLGMEERARLFGGKLSIKGVVGKGTTVTVQMPY